MISSKLKTLIFIGCSSLIFGCASNITTTDPKQQPEQSQASQEQLDSPSARIQYKLATQYQAEPQHYHLLKAARLAIAEQDYLLALAISENLKQSPYPNIKAQNILPLLQAYIATEQHQSLQLLLRNTTISQIAEEDSAEYLWLSSQYLSQQQRLLAASRNLLLLADVPNSQTTYPEHMALLWQNITALTDNQLLSLQSNPNSPSSSWLALADLSRRLLGQPEQLQAAYADWQQRNPWMPQPQAMPETVQQLLSLQPFQPQKIAVLLPLSGQFRQHALAIQYGILAAAAKAQSSQIIFIDSEQSPQQLVEQLTAEQADFVLGPLLKNQVDTISQLEQWIWPTLFLNSQDSQLPYHNKHFFFALSMEDEAQQTALLFQQKDYQQPVVISAANNISLRMQQQFSQSWQQLGHKAPQLYQFNDKADLDTLINQLLETEQSKERVQQIDNLVPVKLHSDTHSRLDIDAIYLIADPVQTQLFKPFVDVSVSETAPRLPIYASSRSHSTALDSTEQRDLNGLTFTEMPWMLPLKTNPALREEYQQLFQTQDESLQRLFAMGFDAYRLIGSLRQQQQLSAIVFPGLTGQLRLNSNGSIVRQLSWAKYQNNRLVAVQEP
ncbi:penicillin-binding protein activator [Rheinheimera sp. MMS21-TC3]|uniref:penicillin-binding protein activator n=1 Tax=Rheinheimera sp. MMS21-TC3 TaxID=3072790 RepID=UPI0028C464EA|nr:penicillin-binding protein activator [Rheinheimera sp. MMS21-TC3]WNO60313.1 penicillin-binding protein activator [Rheinheimera sp. MMS21-TC3]